MDKKEARDAVAQYMSQNERRYMRLLKAANELAEIVKEAMGEGVIFDIYSRGKKQENGLQLKSQAKIAAKFIEKFGENSSYRIDYMVDIVGMTIVVYYDDQIQSVISKIQEIAPSKNLFLEKYSLPGGETSWTKVHKEKGYHATHLKVMSIDPDLRGIRLEIQIKTMLHDAWGAKMHDLTYKPTGELDPKLRALMESFGDSLQAIEVQSETLRDAIQSRVEILRGRRRAARIGLMDRLKSYTGNGEPEFHACFEKIKGDAAHLSRCPTDDTRMIDVTRAIDGLAANGVPAFDRLKLSVYLASLRDGADLSAMVDDAYTQWLDGGDKPENEVWVRMSVLHQTNRVDEAIEYARQVLPPSPASAIDALLSLNLVNYMTERALDGKAEPVAKAQVTEMLVSIKPILEAEPDYPHRGAVMCTEAAVLIVFGDEHELERGIELAFDALKIVDAVGKRYCDLYLAYGWQRKLRT